MGAEDGVYRRGLICTRTRWIDHPFSFIYSGVDEILETDHIVMGIHPCQSLLLVRTLYIQ